jgi:predicted GH43/DUF377 family glycosyl hydrolase
VIWQSEVIQAVSWLYYGPPMETDAGWLVLTHGVGPMRTYPIGAILFDLDNPKRILGQLRQQLLSPAPDEQNGYMPNVFYSCDALVHAETMVLTYGTGDAAIGVATVSLPELLDALSPSPTRPRCRPRCASTMLTWLSAGRLLEV